MKKSIFMLVALCSLVGSATVFADTTVQTIVVQTVAGKVEREVAAGKWEAVTVGMKLAPTDVINTGLNASLVLKTGERLVTVKAMQKGTVQALTSGTASAKPAIKLGAKVTASDVNAEADQGRTNISTASTRAADATKDLQWAEE